MTELRPSVVDARFDGADRDAQHVGDVGVLEFAQIAEEDRLDESIVELLGRVEDVDAGTSDDARRRAAGRQIRRRFEDTSAALQLAVGVDRRVGCQLIHPRRELRPPLEGVDPPSDGEQCVLGGFFRVQRIWQEASAASEDQWPGLDEQGIQRSLVTCGGLAADHFDLRELHGQTPERRRRARSGAGEASVRRSRIGR